MRHPHPLIIAAATITTLAACSGADSQTREQAQTARPVVRAFTSDASGFDTRSFYIDSGEEVIVFDAQFTPALAEAMIAEIKQHTSSPITRVVITHPNPDKFNGATAFQRLGARVIASEATAAAIPDVHAYKSYYFTQIAKTFTAETYPKAPTIDETFKGSLTLELGGGLTVQLKELAHAGVSSTQTVAYVPDAQAIFVGDLVHHKAHAWLEGGIVGGKPAPDLSAWRAALDELRAWPDATVYGGRGEAVKVAVAIDAQAAYLKRAEDITRAYIKGMEDPGALSGDAAATHHAAIAKQIIDASPGYALPYMVEYSVYGLAGALAAQGSAEQ